MRGSGTSGYVQTNKFNLRPGAYQRRDEGREGRGPEQRQPNKDILEHNRKREVELQVEVLRAQLEDDGCVRLCGARGGVEKGVAPRERGRGLTWAGL